MPSLTILISNMGDTIVKWVTDLTNWIGSLTVLPYDGSLRASIRKESRHTGELIHDLFQSFTYPGVFGTAPVEHAKREASSEYEDKMAGRIAKRLHAYVDDEASHQPAGGTSEQDKEENGHDRPGGMDKDIQFYHYVLARECRNVQKHLNVSPPKQYTWPEWEYFLKLMGDEEESEGYAGQQISDVMVPERLRVPKGLASADGNIDRQTSAVLDMEAHRKEHKRRHRKSVKLEPRFDHHWSWLSDESPLMSSKSEAEWILERLSAALERELNRRRKGYKRKPPITLDDAYRH